MQAEQSILDRIHRRQLKCYGHLLRMEDSHWPKKFTSGHRTVGGEEEDRNNHDFMKSRNMEEDMAENRHLWRLGVDGRLLAV